MVPGAVPTAAEVVGALGTLLTMGVFPINVLVVAVLVAGCCCCGTTVLACNWGSICVCGAAAGIAAAGTVDNGAMGVAIGARAFITGAFGTTGAVPFMFDANGWAMALFVVGGWILFGAEAVGEKASVLILDAGADASVTGVSAEAEGENGSVFMPLFV